MKAGIDVYDIAVKKLNEYFVPKKSSAFERHLFFNLAQNYEESTDNFAYRLRKQANKCNFKNNIDDYIRDQITSKTKNKKLRVHILKHSEVSFDEILLIAKTVEAAYFQKRKFAKKEINSKVESK